MSNSSPLPSNCTVPFCSWWMFLIKQQISVGSFCIWAIPVQKQKAATLWQHVGSRPWSRLALSSPYLALKTTKQLQKASALDTCRQRWHAPLKIRQERPQTISSLKKETLLSKLQNILPLLPAYKLFHGLNHTHLVGIYSGHIQPTASIPL